MVLPPFSTILMWCHSMLSTSQLIFLASWSSLSFINSFFFLVSYFLLLVIVYIIITVVLSWLSDVFSFLCFGLLFWHLFRFFFTCDAAHGYIGVFKVKSFFGWLFSFLFFFLVWLFLLAFSYFWFMSSLSLLIMLLMLEWCTHGDMITSLFLSFPIVSRFGLPFVVSIFFSFFFLGFPILFVPMVSSR